jgi:hypothetical protein
MLLHGMREYESPELNNSKNSRKFNLLLINGAEFILIFCGVKSKKIIQRMCKGPVIAFSFLTHKAAMFFTG